MPRRVVVVGAGLIGVSTAWQLAVRGESVVLVDARQPGDGTSGTSFAWLNANSKQPRAYFDLNLAGMAAHRRLQTEAAHTTWLQFSGHLQWAGSVAEQERLSSKVERLQNWDYRVVELSTHQAHELEPDLVLNDARGDVAFYPDEGFAYPRVLLGFLLRRAVAAGVECRFDREVVALQSSDNRVCASRLSDGETLRADVFVLAAGRWTDQVARLAGTNVALLSAEPGSAALGFLGYTWALTAGINRVISAPDLNLRPDGGGRLVLQALDLDHAADLASPPPPDSAIGQELLRRLVGRVRGTASARLDALRVGVRPLPADGLPVVGWAPEVPGLYVVVTHSGVTLGPLLGQLAAEEIASGNEASALRPYRPERSRQSV